MYRFECEECGGSNIEMMAWIDPNTDQVTDSDCICGGDDQWCNDCEKHVGFNAIEIPEQKS